MNTTKLEPRLQRLIDLGESGTDIIHGELKNLMYEVETRLGHQDYNQDYLDGLLEAYTNVYQLTYQLAFAISDRRVNLTNQQQ